MIEEIEDELSKEYAMHELFLFVSNIFKNFLQTGTVIYWRLYTYRRSFYQLFLPFPQ